MKYRIKKVDYGTVCDYYVQYRVLGVLWLTEEDALHGDMSFSTEEEARCYIDKCSTEPKISFIKYSRK